MPDFEDLVQKHEGMSLEGGRLVIDGDVLLPLSLDVEDLAREPTVRLTYDFHCHEGWTRPGIVWEGVPVASLLARARPRATGRSVTVHAGTYTIVLSLEQAAAPGVLLALRQDGAPLEPQHGAPFRLVGPPGWDCYSSVKWVERLEITHEPADASGPAIALARLNRTP